MTLSSRSLVVLISCVLAVGAAACGGSSSSSPTAPAQAPASGATLVGTVETAASPASVAAAPSVTAQSASRSGIRVTVVGSSTATVTDDSGRFVLTGLPAGSVTLHFDGDGLSGQLVIDGLVAGQTLTITCHLSSGGTTVVKPGDESEVEFTGAVESVTPPTLHVAGRTVTTDANTRIRGRDGQTIALASLQTGDVVDVDGMLQADGTILARSIRLQGKGEEPPENDEVELSGAIQSKAATSFMVANQTVMVDGNTKITGGDDHHMPITFAALQVGQKVEVEGRTQTNGTILATKIELEGSDD